MRYAVLVLLSACVHQGNGEAETVSVDLTDVVAVVNHTQLVVTVTVDPAATEASAEVTCDSNLIDFIEAEVDGDVFDVRMADPILIEPRATCEVNATVLLLEELRGTGSGKTIGTGDLTGFTDGSVTGSGPLELDGIVGTEVELASTGSGELTAAGTASRLDLDHTGSGAVDAEGLIAVDAVIHNSGSGSTSVTVTRDIEVTLTGSGGVDVYGDPSGTVVFDDSGSGNVTLH